MKFDLEVKRGKRKTVSITVSSENKIIVRCPQFMSEKRINDYISANRGWIEKKINQNALNSAKYRNVKEYNEILISGRQVPLNFSDCNKITDDAVYIKKLSDLKNLFVKHFSGEFIDSVRELSENLGLTVRNISFKSYKCRWGCCDRSNNVTFNYMVFMLPDRLQKYVMIHELCHTVEFNHSPSFWNIVESFQPDYKIMRKQLKNYSFLTRLY